MGVIGSDRTTRLGCRIRVLNVEREDDMDVMLALTMEGDDDRHAEVLLNRNDRLMLINGLARSDERAWPNMTPHQLLAEAQAAFEMGMESAASILVAAAQAQATAAVDWTLENRVAARMSG